MANLSKYELAEDRYTTLLLGGLTAREALNYMISNIDLYIILQNIDSPQDRNLMNVQLANIMWYTKNVFADGQALQDTLKLKTTNEKDPLYGELVWDSANQTLAIGMGDGVVLQSGQEMLRIVRNNTASTITNGTVVKMVGSLGNSGRITVEPSTGLFNEAAKVFGIATHDIEAGTDGFVTVFGHVRGINTTGSTSGETWVDGDLLYLRPNDNGKLTKIVPTDTQIKMQIAKVVKAHANGTLDVFITPINENAVAATAKKLAVARKINNVNFDGSADISIENRISTPIASAATVQVGASGTGDYIHITGTTTITSLGTAQAIGVKRTLIFDAALTVTHNTTSLKIPGNTNLVATAGTLIEVVAETTTNWRVISISIPNVSPASLSYLSGVTSSIQTQLNSKVDKTSNTGSLVIPSGNTAQRDATPENGWMRYNNETLGWEGYSNGSWQPIGGGQMLGQSLVKAISYNSQVIDENITIPAGLNAYSVGDITVEDGFTVTVENGSVYKIL